MLKTKENQHRKVHVLPRIIYELLVELLNCAILKH